MEVVAYLSREVPGQRAPWRVQVIRAVMGAQISRFPWLVAMVAHRDTPQALLHDPEIPFELHVQHVQAPDPAAAGQYTVTQSTACVQESNTAWYVGAAHQQRPGEPCVLLLHGAPRHALTLAPFAHDTLALDELVRRHVTRDVHSWDTGAMWTPRFDGSLTCETLVSVGETREQLARRLAEYSGAFFTLQPRARTPHAAASGWSLRWSDSLERLSGALPAGMAGEAREPTRVAPIEQACALAFDSESLGWALDIAARAAERGARASEPYARLLPRAVTVSSGTRRQADQVSLPSPLQAVWYRTSAPDQTTLWPGSQLEHPAAHTIIGALHVIGEHQDVRECEATCARHLGQRIPAGAPGTPGGYLALTLGVPHTQDHLPPPVMGALLARARFDELGEQLVRTLGLGAWPLGADGPAAPPGLLPAVIERSPSGQVVDRAEDARSYVHKIWVRLAGIDGVLRAHWITPFASRNEDGTAKGDLVLVPEVGSAGYVLLTAGHGMPVFIGQTHYQDMSTTSLIDANDCRHALATDGGLRIEEQSSHIRVKAPLLHQQSTQMLQVIGWNGTLPSVAELLTMESIPGMDED